jgi:hypothetical protein
MPFSVAKIVQTQSFRFLSFKTVGERFIGGDRNLGSIEMLDMMSWYL